MARRRTWAVLLLAAVLVGQPGNARGEDQADADPSAREAAAYRQRLATALDLGFYMVLGTLWYLIDDTSDRDREYEWSFETLKKKFVTRDAFRFDDNTFGVNSPGHPIAGSIYFLSARTHGGNTLEAAATGFLGSVLWELSVEYREVLSLNDLITTPVGGIALGETFFQVGEFFRRSKPTFVNRAIGTFLMGPSAFLPWNQRPPREEHALDRDGYPVDMWRRIHIGAGTELVRVAPGESRASAFLDASARTIDLEDYGRPGVTDPRWISRPLLADLHVRAAASPSGFEGLWLSAETIWSGLYARSVRETDRDMRGAEWLAGLSAIYDFEERSDAAGGDRLEAVSPVGASGHTAVHLGGSQLRFDASLYPVFAAVYSPAWQVIAGEAVEVAPEVLARDSYYFSLGVRATAAIALEWGGWRLGAAARAYRLSSAEWLQIPAEASHLVLADQRLTWEASIARDLSVRGMVAKLAVRNDAHWSRAGETSVEGAQPSMVLQLVHEL